MTTEREVENRPSSLNRSERPKRVPIHGHRDKLSLRGAQPGWHYCVVNDDGGNVDRYLEGGYEFVTHDVTLGDKKINAASQIGQKVSLPVGNGLIGFLMRCPEEIYQEELDLLNQETDEKEAGMKRQLNSRNDGQYGQVEIVTTKSPKPVKRRISVREV